jgi:hypothetical protein
MSTREQVSVPLPGELRESTSPGWVKPGLAAWTALDAVGAEAVRPDNTPRRQLVSLVLSVIGLHASPGSSAFN